jgi:hypothetical protein
MYSQGIAAPPVFSVIIAQLTKFILYVYLERQNEFHLVKYRLIGSTLNGFTWIYHAKKINIVTIFLVPAS